MKETIGYIEKAVISSDGKNRAFLVHRGFPISFEKEVLKTFDDNKRIKLLENVQEEGRKNFGQRNSYEQICIIFSKTKKFYVHEFMLKLRVPCLYEKLNYNGELDLKLYNDQVVWELLEFIYYNNSSSIKLFTERGRRIIYVYKNII